MKRIPKLIAIFLFLISFTGIFAQRITNGLQVLYTFNEGTGTTIHDESGTGEPLDLIIHNPNGVLWTANGLNIISNPNIRSSEVATKIIDSCKTSNEFTFEAWLRPDNLTTRNRTTRLITLSNNNHHKRDFGVTQTADRYDQFIRTSDTDSNGATLTADVSLELTHFVYTRNDTGHAIIYINGVEVSSTDTITGDFSNWDDSYSLVLGNDVVRQLYWEGSFFLTAIYNRALSSSEVLNNFNQGINADYEPIIKLQPVSASVVVGNTVSFSVKAIGEPTLTYQWLKNGISIPGATSPNYTTPELSLSDNNLRYKCLISNNYGNITSNEVSVNVTASGARIVMGAKVLYNFTKGSGNTINDISGIDSPLNFNILNSSAVKWCKYGLKIDSSPNIATAPASKLIDACKVSNEISIEAWVLPLNNTQSGPAKIVSLSSDENNRDFTFGQITNTYNFSLRTTSTDNNGQPSLDTPEINDMSEFMHVVYTRSNSGETKIYINSNEVATGSVNGDFSNWSSYNLLLGSEFGSGSPWLGTINYLSIFDRALSSEEVNHNYLKGPVGVIKMPTELNVSANTLRNITISWTDNSSNEYGFIIERSTDSKTFTVIDTVGIDETTFSDTSVNDGTKYFYRISSYNNEATSEYSENISIITLFPAPSNLTHIIDDVSGTPVLTWDDNSKGEAGFKIERKVVFSSVFEEVGSVGADITTFSDIDVNDSTVYNYKVVAFTKDTTSDYSNETTATVVTFVSNKNILPVDFSLAQNYPNPFNPSTKISFGLPEKSGVTLKIFNLLGQEVLTLLNKEISAGYHAVNYNASSLTSGIYIYSISAKSVSGKNFINTKKMILMK